MEKFRKLDIQLFADDPNPDEEGGKDPTVEELLKSLEELQNTMVPKEEYDKLKESNSKLVKQITTERVFKQDDQTPKELTKQDIIARCEERTSKLGKGNSLDQITLLTENFRDMEKLGMDVSNVDGDIVLGLENLIHESKGDPDVFKALMESRIRITR